MTEKDVIDYSIQLYKRLAKSPSPRGTYAFVLSINRNFLLNEEKKRDLLEYIGLTFDDTIHLINMSSDSTIYLGKRWFDSSGSIFHLISGKQVTLSNEYIISRQKEWSNSVKNRILGELRPLITGWKHDDEGIMSVYQKCISIHQVKNGIPILETALKKFLCEHNIPYQEQVSINNEGCIIGFNTKKAQHRIDFVIGRITVGDSIQKHMVLSCKTSCRERWKQDDWTRKWKPRIYALLTISNDYPPSATFGENNQRLIITSKPKRIDDRIFKLSIDDLVEIIDY